MNQLILLILAIGVIILLIRWRVQIAQKKLEGNVIPDSISTDKQYSDGVIVYFYHQMCGPCRQTGPIIDQFTQIHPDRVKKINVAENQELTFSMGIKSTPTTIFVKNNKILKAIIGPVSENALEALLHLESD